MTFKHCVSMSKHLLWKLHIFVLYARLDVPLKPIFTTSQFLYTRIKTRYKWNLPDWLKWQHVYNSCFILVSIRRIVYLMVFHILCTYRENDWGTDWLCADWHNNRPDAWYVFECISCLRPWKWQTWHEVKP